MDDQTDAAALLDREDATTAAEAIRRGDLSAEALVQSAIERVEARNPTLNAVVSTRFDEALAEARAVDPSAPFAGVPFVIKDLGAAITGLPHTRGSRLWVDDVATEDTELVARYRAAGFIVLATTNAPEMGKNASTEPVVHGPTRNPHDLGRSAGGSSGGTAAAIASGMVSIGHGNDGGGSIRIPASACGLVGLKPSRGRNTGWPAAMLLAYPMACDHVLTRSMRDTARVLDLTAGPMPGDPFVITAPSRPWAEEVGADPEPLTIAIDVTQRDGTPVDPACAAAVEATGRTLESLGHRVVEGSPSLSNDKATEVLATMMGVPLALRVNERLAQLGRPLADDDLEPFTRFMYDTAVEVSGERVLNAMELVEEISREIGRFFVDHDLLLCPTMPVPAPPLGLLDTTSIEAMFEHAATYASLTSQYNTTGQPAISLPLGHDDGGVPVGVQLVARFGREDQLIAVGAQLEHATPWSSEAVFAQ